MKPKVILCSKDEYLARKIALELSCDADFSFLPIPSEAQRYAESALLLWDYDAFPDAFPPSSVLLSREENLPYENAVLPLPLRVGAVRNALFGEKQQGAPRLSLSETDRSACLDGEKIAFSETEFALLSLLYRAGGKSVSRERIAKEVFSEENTQSLTNVYIHYLREKLEKNGEKIIASERGSGYRIDGRFLGETSTRAKGE